MDDKKVIIDQGPFFHGTKAELKIGDVLEPQFLSNYQEKKSNHIYFTATLFESDPNLTDKKFPGNPTRSYRSKSPLKIIAELASWERHSEEEINHMITSLKKLSEEGKNIIYD